MKLKNTDISIKVLTSFFLMALCAVFFVSGMLLKNPFELSTGSSLMDAKEKILRQFTGSTLENAVSGSMSGYLTNPHERRAVVDWLKNGGGRTGFYSRIQPILSRRCGNCHGETTGAGGISLTLYSSLHSYATNKGPSGEDLLRQSHFHLAGIGLLLFALGILIALTDVSRMFQTILIVSLFFSLFTDIACRFWIRIQPEAVWGILAAGIFLYICVALSTVLVIVDIWRQPVSQ